MSYDKNKITYNCEICYYISSNKTDYARHLLTLTHQKNANYHNKTHPLVLTEIYTCPFCKKAFKHRTSIYKHKTICPRPNDTDTECSSIEVAATAATIVANTPILTLPIHAAPHVPVASTEQYLCEVITKNQELTTAMLLLFQQNTEFQNKMMEMCKNGGLGGMSNSHNTNTNSHNNNSTFNMNFFLNEKCKDAMNMKDFVNSIELNITDLENVGRLGYVEGMSNIFIDNLQKTDLYKRPVHCSDIKRETLYVKDNNQWERDGPDHIKMTNAVLAVEHKNVALVNEWAKANPKCLHSNTRENETYFKLSKAATDGEKNGNINKVIRKVAKNVSIDKDINSLSIIDTDMNNITDTYTYKDTDTDAI
jgi:hypothetical protein